MNNYATSFRHLISGKRFWLSSVCLVFAFVELILGRINSVRINLVRTDFEIQWFMFGSSSKSDSDRK